MAGDKVDQATGDVFAYIESLDASEALGELLHIGSMYQSAAGVSLSVGVHPTKLAMMMMPICIALGQQVAKGTGAMVPTPPPRDGMHSCTLIGRSIEASR